MGVEVGSQFSLAANEFQHRLAAIRQGIRGRARLGLASRSLHFGLQRDLQVPLQHPGAKIAISVRPVTARDLDVLLPADVSLLSASDRQEVHWRKGFVRLVGIAGGYVAVDERDGRPAYVQWLLGADRNDVVAKLGGFPQLRRDEALLENAYTPPSHRGLGIMSAAMALIAEKAASVGARYVNTFVGDDNIASLKGCRRAGFSPFMVHERFQFAFGAVKHDRFRVMDINDPRRDWNI